MSETKDEASVTEPVTAPNKPIARKTRSRKRPAKKSPIKRAGQPNESKYPRHSLERSLRVARALLEQNAGRVCTDREAAAYSKVGYNGPFGVELGSGIKYGFLSRPEPGKVAPTALAKQVIRPQSPTEAVDGMRQAVLNAPVISDVYKHYRGENLPDQEFLENAVVDKFSVPRDKVAEFLSIFRSSLESAKLLEKTPAGKERVLDDSHSLGEGEANDARIEKFAKAAKTSTGDSCFVMMPFAKPIGDYYEKIYEPAIKKAHLIPIRADNDIFSTGKVIDQIRSGIENAKVLLCELTGRNPNVLYELGLAHALGKPVVLVSENEHDVPFDLKHIRVIFYDKNDPFWGENLITKVAENVLSAIATPSEATFSGKATH